MIGPVLCMVDLVDAHGMIGPVLCMVDAHGMIGPMLCMVDAHGMIGHYAPPQLRLNGYYPPGISLQSDRSC